jgi:hypothetical protein
VERVLVESHPDELCEVERHRSHRGAEPVTVGGSYGLEPGVQRGVGGQRIVALRHGLLGAPDVPHSWSEVVRGVLPGETVLESALGDHRGGTQVRQHLGDRPLRRVRAAGQLLLSQRSRQVLQAVDGGPQGVEVRLSREEGRVLVGR